MWVWGVGVGALGRCWWTKIKEKRERGRREAALPPPKICTQEEREKDRKLTMVTSSTCIIMTAMATRCIDNDAITCGKYSTAFSLIERYWNLPAC